MHSLASIRSFRGYLDVYCADEEKWSGFAPIRPAAELRQFAARALRLIERAIMANFREGVWVAKKAEKGRDRAARSLSSNLVFAVREICDCRNTAGTAAEGEGENMLAHVEMKGH